MVRASVQADRHREISVPQRWAGVVAVGVLLAGTVGASLVVGLGGDGLSGLGLPDSGLLTQAGLGLIRALSECAAVVTVGSLLLAVFLVPPDAGGRLDTGGQRRCARRGSPRCAGR